jgi:tetratricopeptide (TPR) repeat protein
LIALFFRRCASIIAPIATHCDICGIKALEGESFREEQILFRGTKKYCPACYARFHERVQLFYFFFTVAAVLVALIFAFRGGHSILQSEFGFWMLVCFLQYLLIIPHELGHALAARFFRFSQIRIIIGSGKPLFHFQLFGFPWLINRIPFGGLAYAKPDPATLTRAKWVFFAAGGLIVNTALTLLAWLLMPEGALRDSERTPLEVLLWSNLIVIAQNLAPYTAQTGFGPRATDGKLFLDAIFHWNKPAQSKEEKLSLWHIWLFRILKLFTVIFLAVCTLALGAIAYVLLFGTGLEIGIFLRGGLGVSFLSLALLLGHYTRRLYREPLTAPAHAAFPQSLDWYTDLFSSYPSAAPPRRIRTIRNLVNAADHSRAAAEADELLSLFPNDIGLLGIQSLAYASMNDHARAEASWERILVQITPEQPHIYAGVFALRLIHIMHQGEVARFNSLLEEFLKLPIPDARKILHLDQLASNGLYLDLRAFLPSAEYCIRKALELAPGNLTLQGTLGGLLVERAEFDQAEPFLRACYDRSPALHDKGISGFYLALLAEHRGDRKSAETLAAQSLILYSEPWIALKAEVLFARLKAGS